MERKTAIAAAGAITTTCAAAVAALFMTVGTIAAEAEPYEPIEYRVVSTDGIEDPGVAEVTGTTIYEIEYVDAAQTAAPPFDDDNDSGHHDDDHEDDDHEDDDHEDDDHDD